MGNNFFEPISLLNLPTLREAAKGYRHIGISWKNPRESKYSARNSPEGVFFSVEEIVDKEIDHEGFWINKESKERISYDDIHLIIFYNQPYKGIYGLSNMHTIPIN